MSNNIRNITIIILLLVVIVLLIEPKLNTNTVSEKSNEIPTDSTTVDDSLTMRAFLLEKGYTEKEIELIENKESLEKKMDGEITIHKYIGEPEGSTARKGKVMNDWEGIILKYK